MRSKPLLSHGFWSALCRRLGLALAVMVFCFQGARAANVLFVVSVNPPAAGSGDVLARDIMAQGGHTVTYVTPSAMDAALAGKNIVVVSSTINSGDINTRLRNSTLPVITWESSLFDDFGFTDAGAGNFATDQLFSNINVTNASHPLATGLAAGSQAVYSPQPPNTNAWCLVKGGGTSVATLTGDATKSVLFGFEWNAALVNPVGTSPAMAAPARRVGLYFGDNTLQSTVNGVTTVYANTAGRNRLTSAVNWALSPSITSPSAAGTTNLSGIVGNAFNYTVSAIGMGPITLSTGTLPAGLAFTASTGVISGTPTTATGSPLNVTVTATNAAGSSTKTLAFTINARPTFTTPSANATVNATLNQPFSYQLAASGTTPITFGASQLPSGLTLNGAGLISGTPTAAGSINATLTATNVAGAATNNNLVLTITVAGTPVAPTITTPAASPFALPNAVVGTAIANFTVLATGTAPITFAATGVPAGLSFNTTTGVLSGTPTTVTVPGTPASIVVTATNSVGTSPAKTLTLVIAQRPTITTPAANNTPVSANLNQPFTYQLAASGTAPITFTTSALPAGLSLNGSGAITGTPTATGTTNVTINASNSAGTATNNGLIINLSVVAVPVAPSITTQPVNATVAPGAAASFTVAATGTPAPQYRWYRNGILIPGATVATYGIPSAAFADDGAKFKAEAFNASGVAASEEVTLTVETKAGTLNARVVNATRITATELVTTPQWDIPDYVFEKGYAVPTLDETERFLGTHKHLPDFPSAAEIKARGLNLGEANVRLLKNVEHLTMQVISLQKEMREHDRRLQAKVDSLRALLEDR